MGPAYHKGFPLLGVPENPIDLEVQDTKWIGSPGFFPSLQVGKKCPQILGL